ncbi:MAG: type VI secretion system protein TssA [Desulfobacterales bacterium]|nr:MAG: type VI secretion system protein TssA [Desulfobacterales bacterium]
MSVIDLDRLLAEISPEAPCGENLEEDPAFRELENKIAGTPAKWSGKTKIEEAKDPNWFEIQKSALELLIRTHDLRLATFLTRALVHTAGVGGLCEGLNLLEGFIERYWDTVYPPLDPEDKSPATQRINILSELCEWKVMINPLMKVTLCESAAGRFSLRDIRISTGKKTNELVVSDEEKQSAANLSTIDAAFKDCDGEDLQAAKEATGAALQSLNRMEAELTEKIGAGRAPDFAKLGNVIEEIDAFLAQQLAARKSTSAPEKEADHRQNQNTSVTQPVNRCATPTDRPMETISNRQDVIRILDQICTYYEQNEPASPVPLLLKRARRLVEKDFFEIMQDLAPDSAAKIKTLISGAADGES